MKFLNIFFFFFLLFASTSCSHRLVGTWQVTNYEIINPGERGSSLHNIGEMHFNRNHTGEKRLNYTFFGQRIYDDYPFRWQDYNGYIKIESRGSGLEKTWIVTENDKKYQKWQSTEDNQVQVLELRK